MAENTSWVNQRDGDQLAEELGDWFLQQAGREARLAAPKAIEYGWRSMVQQGKGLAELAGREYTDQGAFELAVWDMVRLKVGRWTEAVMHGKAVSDDTLLDIGIYVKMAQRAREAGAWPGVRPAHELDVDLTDDRPTLTGGAYTFSTYESTTADKIQGR